MPETTHKRVPENADEQLSRLIKLKRLERPDPDFWLRFEQEFRSKQLSSLVRVQPLHARLYRMCSIATRRVAPPAAAALAVTFVAVTNTSYLGHADMKEDARLADANKTPEPTPARAPLFLVGAEEKTLPDREKAATPAFPSSNASAIYHVNLLESASELHGGYQLMTAPVTFSSSTAGEAPALGAKVIRTQGDF